MGIKWMVSDESICIASHLLTNLTLFLTVREILSQQSQSQRSAGKTISPSTTRESQTLCIMYNSNGEMVRFKPKIQYSNPKPYSMPDTGIIAIEIDPKTKKR